MIGYNQFCTVEEASALKKYGIVQQSMAYWYSTAKEMRIVFPNEYYHIERDVKQQPELFYSAFTSQELRIMLPDVLVVDCEHFLLQESRGYGGNFYMIYGQRIGNEKHVNPFYYCMEENELKVRASLLLKLLESKRVDADECNKQLIKFHNSAE